MSAYSDLVLSHGANAYWRLNEPSGTTAADSAGSRTGTISGPVTYGQAGRVAGELAMGFTAACGVTGFTFPSLGTAFTVEAWVYRTGNPIRMGIATRSVFTDGDWQWEYRNTGVVRFLYFVGSYYTLDTTLPVPLSTWTHLVVAGAGGQVTPYVNGVAGTPLAIPLSGAGGGPSGIACVDGAIGTEGWIGRLQDVAIYPTALTPTQIAQHYTIGSTVESVPSAGCDHTTVWSKHLATLSAPTVESERAYLSSLYGEPGGTDMSTLVSRYLQAINCGAVATTPSAPTLSTVAPNTGTQGTMVTVTLTGTGFIAGATGVSVNGVGISVVNIQVTSPTTLTADLAIDAAAPPTARSITVATAGGSSSQAFTVAGPAVLPATGLTFHVNASDADHLWKTFVSGGPHTGVPVDGDSVVVWSDEDGHDLICHQLGVNAVPVWRSTTPLMRQPCLDFTGGQELILTTNADSQRPLSDLITSTAYTYLIAFYAETVTSTLNSYQAHPLLIDNAGYFGATLSLVGGVPNVLAYNYDGTQDYVRLPCAVGASHVLMVRHESGTLYASLDGGAESSVVSGATSVLTGLVQLGFLVTAYDGRIGEIVVYNTALTGTALSAAVTYFTSKWL